VSAGQSVYAGGTERGDSHEAAAPPRPVRAGLRPASRHRNEVRSAASPGRSNEAGAFTLLQVLLHTKLLT